MLSEDVAGERGVSARVESQIGDRPLTALFGADVGSPQLAFKDCSNSAAFFISGCVCPTVFTPQMAENT